MRHRDGPQRLCVYVPKTVRLGSQHLTAHQIACFASSRSSCRLPSQSDPKLVVLGEGAMANGRTLGPGRLYRTLECPKQNVPMCRHLAHTFLGYNYVFPRHDVSVRDHALGVASDANLMIQGAVGSEVIMSTLFGVPRRLVLQ
jgi:hypothetical protein